MSKKIVTEKLADCRLDKTVRELFEIPWSRAKSWIAKGKIFVGGAVCLDPALVVSSGQIIECKIDAPKPLGENEFDPRCIVYMDNHLIVASKPSGILTVPYERGDTLTFDRQLRTHLSKIVPKTQKRKGALPSLMVVHRLDKGTSGLLVFPRTWAAKEGLAEQFRDHSIERTYLALVHGAAKSQTIRSHFVEDRGDGIRGSSETSYNPKIRRQAKGQLAITHITCVEQYDRASLIECKLETGRTNQIRIHTSEQGNPVVGEHVYMRSYRGEKIKSDRLMLHAAKLGFVHPINQKQLLFEQPLPKVFQEMKDKLQSS